MALTGLLFVVCLAQTPTALPTDTPSGPHLEPVPAPPPALNVGPAAGLGLGVGGQYGSIVKEDVAPSLSIIRNDTLDVRVGGLLQLHTALYAGPEALIANGDLANQPGFRVRRARFGFDGWFKKTVGLMLVVNALDPDPNVGILSDANITFDLRQWMRVSVGTSKVPFSRVALESSRTLSSIERPLAVTLLTPSQRLGLTVEGDLFGRKLSYLAAVMNGTEGAFFGNRYGGILTGLRLVYTIVGMPARGVPGSSGIALGGGVLYENGPAVRTTSGAVDVLLTYRGASLQAEALCDVKTPQVSSVGVGVADSVSRCGGYGELGYAFGAWNKPVQLVARMEYLDDNRAINDAGDALIFAGGFNVGIYENWVRAQLHYVMRRERFVAQRANDGLVLALQGAF